MRNRGRRLCQSCSCIKFVGNLKGDWTLGSPYPFRNDEKERFSTASKARVTLRAIILILLL